MVPMTQIILAIIQIGPPKIRRRVVIISVVVHLAEGSDEI